jgi:predicted transcriptional regulator
MIREVSENEAQLNRLIEALAPRLSTPKAELVKEIEDRLTALLGVEVREVFERVAAAQHHPASSPNLDRVHKSALVLLAHVLGKVQAGS